MKTRLDRVTVVEVEVELPTSCPHCGNDFKDNHHSLRQDQLVSAVQEVGLDEDGTEFDDDWSSGEYYYEDSLVSGYICVACGEVVVNASDPAAVVVGSPRQF